MRRLDGIAVEVDDPHAGEVRVDARQRPVRHVVAVPEEDDVRLPVPRRLHEARVHHPRADVPHETERREEARDVAFGERVDLPAVPQRPRDEA